jgi:hypothetical protein
MTFTLIWGITADQHGISSAELEDFFKRMLGPDIRTIKDLDKGSFKVAKDFDSLDKVREVIETVTRAYPHQAFWQHINYDWQDVVDEKGDSVECDECGVSIPECERGGM